MGYKLLKQGVRRLMDGVYIPNDERNADWREYMRWLAAGNTPEPIDPDPEPIDQSDLDNMEKSIKVLALLMRKYCNELRAGTYTDKTLTQLKADARAIWTSLP